MESDIEKQVTVLNQILPTDMRFYQPAANPLFKKEMGQSTRTLSTKKYIIILDNTYPARYMPIFLKTYKDRVPSASLRELIVLA